MFTRLYVPQRLKIFFSRHSKELDARLLLLPFAQFEVRRRTVNHAQNAASFLTTNEVLIQSRKSRTDHVLTL